MALSLILLAGLESSQRRHGVHCMDCLLELEPDSLPRRESLNELMSHMTQTAWVTHTDTQHDLSLLDTAVKPIKYHTS